MKLLEMTLYIALLLAPVSVVAADCEGRQAARFRTIALESGRKVAVWYPTTAAEQPLMYTRPSYDFMGNVAYDAPPNVACARVPLVLFSHGLAGCALQSIFFTEELARHGYVVAAPDHIDAGCAMDSVEPTLANIRTDNPFGTPRQWTDASEIDRMHDLRDVMRLVTEDPQFGRIVDASRVGAVGHSLGGYTVVGMAGGWPSWKTPQIKAVLALSPYVAPYIHNGRLAHLGVPVMYQGAQFDWGLTPLLEGWSGAFKRTKPPKYFVKLKSGTHLEWTNLICAGKPNVAACLAQVPNANAIDRYGIAFLDRYLKDERATDLDAKGPELSQYRYDR